MDTSVNTRLNQTVKGVAAAVHSIIIRTHVEFQGQTPTPSSFSMFRCKNAPSNPLDWRSMGVPPFSTVYSFIYKLFRKAQIEPECLIAMLAYYDQLEFNLNHATGMNGSNFCLNSIRFERENSGRNQKFLPGLLGLQQWWMHYATIVDKCNASLQRNVPNCTALVRSSSVPIPQYTPKFGLAAENWERIVFTLMMIASQVFDDVSCSNKSFSMCTHDFTLEELNVMERVILQELNYSLYMHANDYKDYYYALKEIWLALHVNNNLVPMKVNEVNVVIDSKEEEVRITTSIAYVSSNGAPADKPQYVKITDPSRWGIHYIFVEGNFAGNTAFKKVGQFQINHYSKTCVSEAQPLVKQNHTILCSK